MATELTCVCFLIDESGSMESIEDSTKMSIHECAQKLSADGNCIFSLHTFNSGNPEDVNQTIQIQLDCVDTKDDIEFDYEPSGMTALFDAQMVSMNHLYEQIMNAPEEERPSKIIVVTVTDGNENDSSTYTNTEVRIRINELKNTYGWNFIYIGANQDAFLSAANIGVQEEAALNYQATDEGIESAMRSVSRAISSYRRTESLIVEFTQEDRENNT